MLWVFAPIKEEEAKTILLPKIIDLNIFQYPHGFTPPMHYTRKSVSGSALAGLQLRL
jgi:transcription initiation factor TFIID subunit 7